MTHDLVIERARIVDGTGAPWFRGAVVVDEGRISELAREARHGLEGETVLDVDDAAVAPGFIDAHSHSDLAAFTDPELAPKTRQGITTEVVGQDGFSMAPLYREGGPERWRRHLQGLTGPFEGDWRWERLGEYLDAIDEAGAAANVATLVGHGTARFGVRGMDEGEATDDELERMAALVAEGLEDGAVGLSTGLVYTPQVYSDTREIRRLARELEPYGRPFVAHIRSEGRWIWEAMDEFIDVGAETGVPLHVSHFKVTGTTQQGKAARAVDLLETARERGVDVTADQYPYTAGSSMLTALLPPWAQSQDAAGLRETLADSDARERLRRDIEEWRIDGWENVAGKVGWENLAATNLTAEETERYDGRPIAEIARDRGVRPIDALCDVLLAEDLDANSIAHAMAEPDVREILASERIAVGTDGLFGGRPHPRVYGTYPRILGRYVREENLLSLESAVRMMTALPARIYGLDRKGVIRPGMDADLVVFDPEIVGTRASFDDPVQFPTGIRHIFVDGKATVRDGETTGALPGTAVRA